jgi:hypothetical protein
VPPAAKKLMGISANAACADPVWVFSKHFLRRNI